jgi:hypothetical protein
MALAYRSDFLVHLSNILALEVLAVKAGFRAA